MTTTPPPTELPAAPVRTRRTWDLVLSIVLAVLALGLGLVLFSIAPFLVMASDSCGASSVCDTGRISAGFLLAWFGPAVVILVGIIATVVLLVLKRLAFWAPLAAIASGVGIFVLGAVIVFGGVQNATG